MKFLRIAFLLLIMNNFCSAQKLLYCDLEVDIIWKGESLDLCSDLKDIKSFFGEPDDIIKEADYSLVLNYDNTVFLYYGTHNNDNHEIWLEDILIREDMALRLRNTGEQFSLGMNEANLKSNKEFNKDGNDYHRFVASYYALRIKVTGGIVNRIRIYRAF